MHIEKALERFLFQLKADGRSPHTIGQYLRHLGLLARWARTVGPRFERIEGLDHEALARFLASPLATRRLGGAEKLPASVNCLRSSLKGFFSYLHRAGYLPRDPGRVIRRALCGRPVPRTFSEGEERRFLATLSKAKDPGGLRDHMLFRLMLATGMRLGSAIALDVEDLDLTRGEVEVHKAKGNRPERLFLGKSIRKDLRRFLAGRSGGPLFQGRSGKRLGARHVHRRMKAWLKAAGVTRKASPHSLRHTFAARVYRKTRDILLVKEALHHRSIASTLVYAHADQERLEKALA